MRSDSSPARETGVPLSARQVGMWAAQQLFPDTGAFLACRVVWFSEPIDSVAFAKAADCAIQETEALRARFETDDDGQPFQVIDDRPSIATRVIDTAQSDDVIRARARERLTHSSLDGDPTPSVLYKRAAGGWAWCFTVNSLKLDGYGSVLLIHRIEELYAATINGDSLTPRRFGRLADVVDSTLGGATPGDIEYWRNVLDVDSVPPSSDDQRLLAELFSYSYDPKRLELPNDFECRLQEFASEIGVSWVDVLVAAWGLYTAIAEGRDFLGVRVPLTMRDGARELRTTPCAVARALPVVLNIKPSTEYGAAIRAVASQVKNMKRHSAIDDHELGRLWSGGEFAYLSLPSINIMIFDSNPSFGGAAAVVEGVSSGPTGVLDLAVHGSPGRGFRMEVTGRTPFVSGKESDRHAVEFVRFLERALGMSGAATMYDLAARVSRVSDADLDEWSTGTATPGMGVTVDFLMREQVRRSANAVAVIEDNDGSELSYGEFDSRVNSLAQLLVDQGLNVGDRVAVILPRSTNLLLTLCAVIRAGAAYVPVDPKYPAERIIAILEDSAAPFAITDQNTKVNHEEILADAGVEVIDIEAGPARTHLQKGQPLPPALSRPLKPTDPVYVIFTSGTTGRPKGVVLSHRAVANRLVWGRDELRYTAADRVLLKTPATFDVSVPELFLPLIVGATVVIAADRAHGDPEYIVQVLNWRKITSVHFVPSMLQAFLDADINPGPFPAVRIVSFTGEALPAAAAIRARKIFSNAQLYNLYGPTEAAIEITSYDIEGLDEDAESTPIGRPISNSSAWVLDGWLRATGVGVVGELYLGGIQLADGYAGRSAATAERFIADPYSATGERLYRTGDLVRWNHQGQLEYLGRTDDQVKVRGFRIELDEVRSALQRHDSVSGAVVIARQHPAGGTYLAAYITTSSGHGVSDSELLEQLREHLASHVPEYMIPATFTRIESFPVTTSGKLDRNRLPAPSLGHSAGTGRSPESRAEVAIVNALRQVLHLSDDTPLTTDDDFFRLGGHSLLATRLVARVNADLDGNLSLRDVFSHPVVGDLARTVDAASAPVVPRVGEVLRPVPLPASPGQQALWVAEQIAQRSIFRIMLMLEAQGEIDTGALEIAVWRLLDRHEILRTTFDFDETTAVLTQTLHVPPADIGPLVAITDLGSASVSDIAANLAVAPMDLASEFGIRFQLVRGGEGDGDTLIAAVHHLVIDEESIGLLLRDLNALYLQQLEARPALQALPQVQFGDFSTWWPLLLGDQHDPTSPYRVGLEFWRRELDGLPSETALPLDHARSDADSRTIRPVTVELCHDQRTSLEQSLAQNRATPLQALFAALALTLWSEGSGSVVPVGTPASLRDQAELSDVIGFLANTVVIRMDVEPDAGFRSLLEAARERTIDSQEHKFIPFASVVDAIAPARVRGVNPLFQVMAAYIDQRERAAAPDAPFQIRPQPKGLGQETNRPALADLVFSIIRRRDGALMLNLNATVELFSERTAWRLLRKMQLFLDLGTRYPELPAIHLAQLVCAEIDGASRSVLSKAAKPVFGISVPQIEIADMMRWQAAVHQVSLALPNSNLELRVNGDGAELTASSDDPTVLDTARDATSDLAAAFLSSAPMVVSDLVGDATKRSDAELGAALEDPHWDEWIDGLCEAPEPTYSSSDTPAKLAGSTVSIVARRTDDPDVALGSVLRAVATALLVEPEPGRLLVEVRSGDGAAVRRNHPVILERTEGAEEGPGLGLSSQFALDYAVMSVHPEFSRFFDDVPAPKVRVSLFPSAARRLSEHLGAGGVQLDIRVLVSPPRSGEAQIVRIEVETAAGIDFDPATVANDIAEALVAGNPTLNISRRRNGMSVCRADRLALSTEDIRRIREQFGSDARVLPLSTLQRGIFYHMVRSRETGDHNAYVSQAIRELHGQVDVREMERAARSVFDRYPNLRAAFIPSGEAQVIPGRAELPFQVFRYEEWSELGREPEEFLESVRRTPFDFEEAPLIRFVLLERDPNTWCLAMAFEHIILDGWSLNAVLDEILEIYADPGYADRNRPASFTDYLEWLASRDIGATERAWAEYLAGLPGPGILWKASSDLSDVRVETGELHRDLDSATAGAVYRAARESGVTVGTVLQTAWGIALGRLLGATDVLFGNTVSGRPADLPDADRIIGLLFNTVPMRVRITPFETVRELLRRVQAEQLVVIDHPDASLTDIQRSAGFNSLFDTLFVVQNHPFGVPTDGGGWAGLKLVASTVNDATHYPLTFAVNPWVQDGGARVHVRLSYRHDAFDDADAGRVLARYLKVLTALVDGLDERVGSLPALLAHEVEPRAGLPADLRRDTPEVTVGDLLSAQVARSSKRVALVAGDRQFTFAELGAEVNRYARFLLACGVRPEHRVALFLPRDDRMVIAMFAVFAVGAAYVPIDSELPDERIAYMLEVASPTVTLVTTCDVRRIDSRAGATKDLDDDDVRTRISQMDPGPITVKERGAQVSLDNLAYIIFTSGSTGRPKGVAVGYRGLTNMYVNHVEKIFDRVVAHQGGRRIRIAHTTSFSFDASWEQLFWMLNGHSVYVIDEAMRRDPQNLLAYYDHHRIDGFDVTPSYAQVLVDEGLLDRVRPAGRSVSTDGCGVVFVSFGGEAVPERLWRQFRDAPGVESYNLYGPTEYTINALGADLSDSATPSVGTPVFNTRAYILDENLQPTVAGVAGELYLAGSGTARGYWGQPTLTAERFVACPWEPGERMYRTGDLACWNSEGHIDYLGRADEQVKIRGYRIEPDEVRTVLDEHPLVATAAVVAADHPAGGKMLAAYIITVPGADVSDAALGDSLRSHMQRRVPEYMVPASYVRVDEFPLTPNGKLDRRALPEPELGRMAAVGRAPETHTELTLMEALRDVLRLGEDANCTVDDDFFSLGGDSILSIQLISRARRAGVTITAAEVFSTRTVSGLARLADERASRESTTVAEVDEVLTDAIRVLLRPATNGRHLFAVHAREGFALLYGALQKYLPVGIGLVGLQDPAHGGVDADLSSRNEVAAVYADAMQQVQPAGPYDLFGWSLGGHLAFSVGQELQRRGECVASLIIVDTPSTVWENKARLGQSWDGFNPVYQEREALDAIIRGSRGRWLEMLGLDPDDDASDDVLEAMAVSTIRGGRVMATATTGQLDTSALLVMTKALADGNQAVDLSWEAYLRSCTTISVADEDHYSIVSGGAGLPKWGPQMRQYLTDRICQTGELPAERSDPGSRSPLAPVPALAVDGTALRYFDYGDPGDPLLVLVQGVGARGSVWTLHQVPAFVAAGYRVVTVDNRGMTPMPGQTEASCPEIGVGDLVDDLVGLIEHLGGPAHVVGTSLGARVVQELSLARPDLVTSAVVMAGHARINEVGQLLTRGQQEVFDREVDLPRAYKAAIDALLYLSPATLRDGKAAPDWLAMLTHSAQTMSSGERGQLGASERLGDRTSVYGDIARPLLVIGFADDLIIPTYLCREVADVVPGARYVEVPDTGHFGYLEAPDAVNRIVLDFVKEHGTPR